MKTSQNPSGGPLADFINQHGSQVIGVLEGFDRVRAQASLPSLYHPAVMEYYLRSQKVLFKDFKGYVTGLTDRVRAAAAEGAERAGRRVIYLQGNCYHKEDLARREMESQRITAGLITVISAVEPCRTWFMRGNRQSRKLELKMQWGKCIHLYFYYLHERLGFLNLRLQTWFPFLAQVCFNGREWLARQMDRIGLKYRRRDNCFEWIEDVAQAQALMEEQRRTNWQPLLDPLLEACHPLHREICRPIGAAYYWTVAESEYATDVMFQKQADLQAVYPAMVHHSVMSFGSEQVLRFQQRTKAKEVKSDRRRTPDGVRVKHWINDNSLKLYDKGSVLRSEVTINNPRDFRVFRAPHHDPKAAKRWRILRRTIADVPRRAEVCQAANHRHLQALSVVQLKTPLAQEAQALCQPVCKQGRRYRALRPWAQDAPLLQAVSRLEFAIQGFHNRDIRHILHPAKISGAEARREAAAVGRRLAILRAHGLIRKAPQRHLYHVTAKGRRLITALLAARHASIDELTKMAA